MDGIAALAALPNTICKISGIIARTRPGWTASDLAPAVDHCLDSFGPDRVVFGGDWPVCTLGADATYRAWAEALKTIIADRSEASSANCCTTTQPRSTIWSERESAGGGAAAAGLVE